MYKKLLVPLDGSDLAESVLPYAMQLAGTFNAELALVFAVASLHEEVPEHVTSAAAGNAESYLKGVASGLPQNLMPRYQVKAGDPAQVIVDAAETERDTLVIMATHGYSGLQKWLLGSVANKVIQVVNTPVLLLPQHAKCADEAQVKLERVIVPLDGSRLAECILATVVPLCEAMNMELIVVRAYNPHFPGSSIRMHDISDLVHASAENYAKDMVGKLRELGLKKVSYKTLRGIPAEQITDFAIQTENSLTAMCTHGRNGLGRWVLGSVTDAVVHSSTEPVLVVRGRPDEFAPD